MVYQDQILKLALNNINNFTLLEINCKRNITKHDFHFLHTKEKN